MPATSGAFWRPALTCAPAPVSPNACGRRASALRPSAITGICLRLNPNDNQGLRHVLTSWLLATGDHGALEELLAAYDDDVFAEWAYAKTLLALRKGDEADGRTALAAAWKRNPHVPALLTGAMPIPEHQDDHYTLGSPDEAFIYVYAKQGKLDGDAGRLAMARRNRANPPAAGRKTALNGKTPCIFVAFRKFI